MGDIELFTKYGFVSESNPHTSIRIAPEIVVNTACAVVGSYADWDERKVL